jgi:hypothetical protein
MKEVIQRRNTCRGCNGYDLELVFSLKPSPIGDAYVKAEAINITQPSYPIDLYMCENCGFAQLLDIIDPSLLYTEYIYVTASSSGLSDHFQSYAKSVIHRCDLESESLVIDLGSNDGTLLRCFQRNGMKVLGVEPAAHIAAEATSSGINTIDKFFTQDLAKEIVKKHGKARLVTANNVFANIDDLTSWILGIKYLLADEGVFVFESYYLGDVLQNMVFDFIYHEHLSSLSVKPMVALFQRLGLELALVERVNTKGGSIRYFVQRADGPLQKDNSVQNMLSYEDNIGLYKKETFNEYKNKINDLKQLTRQYISSAKLEGKSIVGYGASITGTTLIYHFEIGEYLDYLVDDNHEKQGRYSPGLHLPVLPPSVLSELKPDIVIILAWRFAEIIIKKHQAYVDIGGPFLVPVPIFRV